MSKLLFLPFSLISGLVAGKLAEKTFTGLWRLVDKQESPKPDHRLARWPKLVLALTVEGAIFRLVRGSVDRATRVLFTRLTGSWPGEEAPSKA